MNDLRVNDDFEMLVSAGDFVIDTSNQQHIGTMLKTRIGELKQFPASGVGIEDMLLGDEVIEFKHKIRKQLTDDGATVTKIDFTSKNKLTLNADYTS